MTEDDAQPPELIPLRHGGVGWYSLPLPPLREIDFLLRDLAGIDPERNRSQQLHAAHTVARLLALLAELDEARRVPRAGGVGGLLFERGADRRVASTARHPRVTRLRVGR